MLKNKRNRSWFENKTCQGCGKPGTTFRYFDRRHQYIICDSPLCSLRSRIKAGYFKTKLNLKIK